MTTEPFEIPSESLGQVLRKTRIELGLELDQIGDETKISASNLKAMENDDYGSLPADAFARGFYGLYAKTLKLNPEDVIKRFLAERGSPQRKDAHTSHNPPAHKAAQEISNMAEPSGVSPMSTIGLALLLLILLAGGVFWYFDINPATFISEKIRGIEEPESPGLNPLDEDSSSQILEPETTNEKVADNVLQMYSKTLPGQRYKEGMFYILQSSTYSGETTDTHLQG